MVASVRSVLKLVSAILKLAVYLAILAAAGYAAIYYRADLAAEARKLGAPEATVAAATGHLDQGARLIVANAAKLPFTLPVPLPAIESGATGDKPADAKTEPGKPQPVQASLAPAQPAKPAAPAIPVLAAEVKSQPRPVVVDLLGTVQAIASIPLKSRLDSQIESLEVKEGDAVKAGQLLIRLDARAIRAQIKQAEAFIVRDQALVDQSAAELERVKPLANTNIMSRKDLDTAKSTAATAQGNLVADKASLDNLRVQESYYEIRSPIDGRIGALPYKPGASIRAADAVLLGTINQTSPVYVAFAVPQAYVPKVREALRQSQLPVAVTVPGSKGDHLPGSVTFTENSLDAASGTLTVKATVDNPGEQLIPGQLVEVRVTLRTDDNAIVVPDAAVMTGQQGPYVFTIKPDNTVELVPVTLDRKIDGQAVISKGVSAGQRVVIDGQARLVANSRVDVRTSAVPGQSQK